MFTGSLDMQDSISPSVTFTGVAMTLSADHIIQIIGIAVGVFGIVLGIFRYYEARRANNINDRKLKLEEKQHAESTHTTNSPKSTKE